MNDFLRNLRSSHKKETPPPRKSTESHYYPQQDRRILSDRRTPPHAHPQHQQHQQLPPRQSPAVEDMAEQLSEILPLLLDNTTALTGQVEKLATINEMVMESTIRKNNAVADFFENMGKFLAEAPRYDGREQPKATTSYASGTHYTKDDILSIIHNMRDQGATFAIIAEYLREKGIPTFSGRGEWHAQTIHRLCK
ncbi:MAG: recombinase family protein [Desulfobacterales bacterium]|nr:recombinase family protein [Desulfobacterales bacterium]